MPTYKGNKGNLLQHWVLSELTTLLGAAFNGRLCFIDAHAMSPHAVRSDDPGATAREFNFVATRLPGQETAYERSWYGLKTSHVQYPTSAMFVRDLWQGSLHQVLCERDADSANDVSDWIRTLDPTKTSSELWRDDWRLRFKTGFPTDVAACLLSFDPYMFDRNGPPQRPNPGNMWPEDIIRIGAAVLSFDAKTPVIIQLSTYSANNNNAQRDVLQSIDPLFAASGLRQRICVRADGNMMSMIYVRGVPDNFATGLDTRFKDWLDA